MIPNPSVSRPPDLGPVADEIEQLRGRRVWVHGMTGNNGDDLIVFGTDVALERAGVIREPDIERADALVMVGGAGITDLWKLGFEVIQDLSQRFPDRELWILPSTLTFETIDFGALFAGRTAPARLWTRELYSYEMLVGVEFPTDVRIGFDDDMAFHLRGSEYLERLKSMRRDDHLLIVERNDAERATGIPHARPVGPASLKRFVPGPLKRWIKQRRNQKAGSSPENFSAWARSCQQRILADHPALADKPVRAWDVSRRDVCSSEQFAESVAHAAAVATTRLHVGILSTMLGIPAYLQFSPTLPHKFRGIYELSLQQHPTVTVLPPFNQSAH